MRRPVLILTVDTEGDNIWACPESVTTENARYMPRFQNLCEDYGYKPTYLVNYEMAIDPFFQQMGRSLVRRTAGEIGLHVHSWNSPPLTPSAYDPRWHHIYLYELSDEMMHAKISYLTKLLTDSFEIHPISHRAGRWGFDQRVARALSEHGYLVDCSVTPDVSWRRYKGAPDGNGGADYFGFPHQPYFLDLSDIKQTGESQLLEVPVTIKPNYHPILQRFHHSIENRLVGRVFRRLFGPPHTWLRPNGRNIDAMLSLVDWAIEQQFPVLEFMIHSSELMPGGSPTFKSSEQIELLYSHLDKLFAHLVSRGAVGMGLGEYRYSLERSVAHRTWSDSVQ